nr:hypothetical protein CFP56_18070 [Quercus suber]
MDETNKVNEKIKELKEALRVEKMLVIQKDGEIQVALLRTNVEREKVIQQFTQSKQFSNLQFIQCFKGFKLLQRWTMKHHSLAMDFSNLDFETIDIEILAYKAKEREEVAATGGTDAAVTEGTDLGQGDETVAPST